MFWDLLIWPVLAFGLSLGVAWPFTSRLKLAPAEKLVANTALSLLGIFLAGWTIYVFGLPSSLCWAIPVLGGAGLLVRRAQVAELWCDATARSVLIGQILVTAWCAGWLATVKSYSGGGWAGDWLEHWERTQFFLLRWPEEFRFLGFYPLTARPPLENIVTGILLRVTTVDFTHFQLVSTLLASLVFLPAALLARRFAPKSAAAVPVLTLLFFLNPLFLQNATFAWTKLPAAFFVLASLAFFLRVHDFDAPAAAGPLMAAFLAGGLLTHYSTGPYAVLLGASWLAFGAKQFRQQDWWRRTLSSSLSGALLLAVWFGWAFLHYGVASTLASNTSVTEFDPETGKQLAKVLLNLRDTLVPHFLRPLDTTLIAQSSPWGNWRDNWFQLYQLNLFFAVGSTAWLVALVATRPAWRSASTSTRSFWALFVAGSVFLGVAVHGARDTWGLTHICLQPLVLLALAFLAARWGEHSPAWKRVALAGAAVDFLLGIVLHFAVENYAFDAWLAPGRSVVDWTARYSPAAMMNLQGKLQHQLTFPGDVIAPTPLIAAVIFASLLGTALYVVRRAAGSKP